MTGPTSRRRMASVATRLSALSASTVLSAVSPLLYIPVVSGRFGADGWSAVAVGQSIGAVGAVLVAFGWVFDGARRLTGRSSADQGAVLQEALGSQLYVAVPVVVLAPSIAVHLTPAHAGAAALAALAAALVGLAPAWFFVGQDRPGRLLLLDGLPKSFGSVLGTGLLLLDARLWLLPMAQIAVSLVALLIATRVGTGRWVIPRSRLSPRMALRTLRTQRAFAVAQLSSVAYINLPTVLVAAVSPAALATFAAGDRLFRLGITALAPLSQFTQAWVPRSDGDRVRRVRVVVQVHAGVGLVSAVVFVLCTPLAERLLFQEIVELPISVTAPYAILFPVVLLSQAVGFNVLALSGRRRVLAQSAVCGAVVGLVAIPALAVLAGAPGGALGVLLAEFAVLARQVGAGRRWLLEGVKGGDGP